MVDLTNYTVDMHLNGELTSMKAVIGKPDRKTPVFQGINDLYGHQPDVARSPSYCQENLPKLQADPNYLIKHRYKVYFELEYRS